MALRVLELQRKDDQLQAMARRLEVLAHASTESHMTDVGYWGERAKRSDFATAAFTVGSSKRAAQKVAQAALRRAKVLDASDANLKAARVGGGGATGRLADATATTTTLPPLKKAAVG